MTTQEKETLFIEAYSFERLTYDEFSSNYNIERAEIPILYDKTRVQTIEIQKIRDKYNSLLNRSKSDFINFKEFYTWFFKQSNSCCYCDIKQNNLIQLFDNGIINSKKFNSTLHIERFDSNKPYSYDNCGLACAICNNAKSDMISKEDFKKFFAPAVKSFFDKYLKEL